jgi:uncharacterized protein
MRKQQYRRVAAAPIARRHGPFDFRSRPLAGEAPACIVAAMSAWWLVVVAGVFLIGLTKSGFGSGMGLMVVPMMTIAMANILPEGGEAAALGLMLPLLILGDLVAVYQYRKLFSLSIIRHLLPGTAAGVVLGAGLLFWFQQQQADVTGALIRIVVGLEAITMVGLHWIRIWRGEQLRYHPVRWRQHLTGTSAGISSTLAHAAGPIIALHLLPQKLDRRIFVGTCAIYFFILNTAKLPAYAWSGMFADASPLFAGVFTPLVLLGAVAGLWLNKRLSDAAFASIVYTTTFVLGIYLLINGAWRLVA